MVLTIDLTGSADHVETGFNVPFEGPTKVACFCAVRSLLLDTVTSEIKVPSNQGSFRPIDMIAPEGSIYNPSFPAAAEARFSQINRVIDLIYKVLASVLPNDIIAGSSATLSFAAYSGVKPDGEYWVFLEVNEGSYGGRPASAAARGNAVCCRSTTRPGRTTSPTCRRSSRACGSPPAT